METEPTNREILEAIHAFAGDVDKRFEGVDKRFESVEMRFDDVDKRFESLESDVKVLKTDVAGLKTDVSVLKEDVTGLKENEDRIIHKLLEHDDRFARIEASMMTKSEGCRLFDALEGLTTAVKRLSEDYVFIIEWLKRLQANDERQEGDIGRIKTRLKMA